MELTAEQLLVKIAMLVMENDALRAELDKFQQKLIEAEKKIEELSKKEDN